jgi:hypothetical protein
MAEGWDFVTGTEDPARVNSVDGRRRRGEANKIIYNSIGDDRQEEMRAMMKAYDIQGMWEGMKKFNKANDEVYISRLRREFYSTIFDPTKMRIVEFLHILNRFKINLASTPRALTNDDIKEQLLLALPSDVTWQNAKTWCLRDKRDLESCITLLQEQETALPTQVQNAALAHERKDEPRGRRGNRGRSRGGRSRGRPGRFDHSSRHSSSSRVSKGPRRPERDECRVCYQKGHYQNDCPLLKQFRFDNAKKKDQGAPKTEEAGNVAIAEEEFDSDSIYLDLDPNPERAMLTTTSPAWALDSGATKHFTGDQSDLAHLKRWNTPRQVRTANGIVVPAVGYGQVQIGSLRLKDVWLVPSFKTIKLISVRTLTQEGYSITFDTDDQATGKHRSGATFKATTKNNLYVLQEPQGAFNATAEAHDSQSNVNETDAELWHRRTGHTNYSDLFKLQHSSLGMRLRKRAVPVGKSTCEACLAGKMREILSKKTTKREKIPGRGLHLDTTGRIGTSIRGYNYYLLALDNAIRYT